MPVGAHVSVQREVGGRDSHSLLCHVPNDLPEDILGTKMSSKSKKISYTIRDVIGKPVGRMQYVLNVAICKLLDEGRVKVVRG